MPLLQTSTISNQNISTVLLVGTYTAGAERTSLMCMVMAAQVASNGIYTIYATRQLGGSGAEYELQGRTSVVVSSGVTSIAFPSIPIPISSGDVVKIYLIGLATDTTTPDIICEFWDLGFLRPTTADRTLDVSATGEAGMDWGNIGSPTSTVGLPNTTMAVGDKTGFSLTAAYDAAKNAASQVSVNAIPTTPLLAGSYTAPDNAGVAAIKAKTDNLPIDPADQSLVEEAINVLSTYISVFIAKSSEVADIPSIKAKTDNLPVSPASTGDVNSAKSDMIAAMPAAPDNAGILAIKAKTDNLPSDPADESLLEAAIGTLATSSALTTVGNNVTAIKAKTDAFPSSVASPDDVTDAKVEILDAINDVAGNPAVAVSATVAAKVASGRLGLQTFYTLKQQITSTTTANLTLASKVWLAIKNENDADEKSLIFIERAGGLLIVNKAEYEITTHGALVVSGSSGTWMIDIEVDEAATALLAAHAGNEYSAELKAKIGGDTISVWSGKADILPGVVRAYE